MRGKGKQRREGGYVRRREDINKLCLVASELMSLATRPTSHWNAKSMRLFLENYAKDRGMDSLSPETWYNTPEKTLRQLPVFLLFSVFLCLFFLILFCLVSLGW